MSKYEDYNWTKSKAIFDMLNMLQVAIKDNRPIITNRAKFMHIAIWLTLVFIIFFDKIR